MQDCCKIHTGFLRDSCRILVGIFAAVLRQCFGVLQVLIEMIEDLLRIFLGLFWDSFEIFGIFCDPRRLVRNLIEGFLGFSHENLKKTFFMIFWLYFGDPEGLLKIIEDCLGSLQDFFL